MSLVVLGLSHHGAPLSLLESGDIISVDTEARVLDLEVSAPVLEARRAQRGEVPLPPARGYLSIYRRLVQPMSTGAVLVTPESAWKAPGSS